MFLSSKNTVFLDEIIRHFCNHHVDLALTVISIKIGPALLYCWYFYTEFINEVI